MTKSHDYMCRNIFYKKMHLIDIIFFGEIKIVLAHLEQKNLVEILVILDMLIMILLLVKNKKHLIEKIFNESSWSWEKSYHLEIQYNIFTDANQFIWLFLNVNRSSHMFKDKGGVMLCLSVKLVGTNLLLVIFWVWYLFIFNFAYVPKFGSGYSFP